MANQIRSDADGFLVGDRSTSADAVKILLQIRNELHALNSRDVGKRSTKPYAVNTVPTANKPKRKRYVINPEYLPPLEAVAATPRRATNPNQQRDASGRFIARTQPPISPRRPTNPARSDNPLAPRNSGQEDNSGEDDKPSKKGKDEDSIIKLAARTAVGAVGGTPDIDPSIAAAKEVGAAVTPIGRGIGKIFSGDKEKGNKVWYRRIWNELRGSRTDDSEYHKAELRRLKAIEDARNGGATGSSGGGILGSIGAMLGNIPGIGPISKVLGTMGGGLLRVGGGLLKKLPLIGGLFAGASAAASIFGPDDENKTPEQNRQDRFTGGGAGVGAIAGGVLGSFFGPIGTVVGGVLGEKIGELVGAWLATFDWGKIGDQIIASWNTAVNKVGDIAKSVGTAWDSVTSYFKNFVKSKTGFDIDAAVTKVKAVASPVVDFVKSVAGNATDYAKGAAGKLAAPIGNVVKSAIGVSNSGLGGLIGRHEGNYNSFNRGIAGDSKGQEMMFENMSVNDIMKEQAKPKNDPSRLFAVGKYQVIPETLKGAATALGLKGDEKFTPELQERIFSEYLADKKRPDISGYITGKHDDLNKATLAASKEWASIADPSTGRSYYDKTGGNKAGISAKKVGEELTTARATYQDLVAGGMDQKQALSIALGGKNSSAVTMAAVTPDAVANAPVLAAASTPTSTVMPTVSAISSSYAPVMKAPPRMSDAPDVSSATVIRPVAQAVTVVQANSGDVGQDLSDRKIAHIATGGIGGSSSNSMF